MAYSGWLARRSVIRRAIARSARSWPAASCGPCCRAGSPPSPGWRRGEGASPCACCGAGREPADLERELVAFQLGSSTVGSAKPGEVIAGLWGDAVAADTDCARVALWAADGDRLIDPLGAAAQRQSPRGAPAVV